MQQYRGNIDLINTFPFASEVFIYNTFAFSELAKIFIWAPTLREVVSFSVIKKKKSNASRNRKLRKMELSLVVILYGALC